VVKITNFLSPTPYPLPQGRGNIIGEGAKPPHLDTPKIIFINTGE